MFLKLYLFTLPILLLIDFMWLKLSFPVFYQKHLSRAITIQINFIPALIFYLLFAAGLVFFCIQPAVEQKSVVVALLRGAFLGFLAYATYDLTNLATIKNWPIGVTVIDILWGTILCAVVSGVALKLVLTSS